MSLSLFDVVGPVMHGPSSSHTAGANRIGYLAGKIMGAVPQSIEFGFNPVFFLSYAGQRSHVALTAGCLGYREDEKQSVGALKEAKARGIEINCYPIYSQDVHRNTMRVHGRVEQINWEINGISIGGGNVIINRINGVEVSLDGNSWSLIMVFTNQEIMEAAGQWFSQKYKNELKASCHGTDSQGNWIYCGAFCCQPLVDLLPEAYRMNLIILRIIKPLSKFCLINNHKPLFSTFSEILQETEYRPLIDIVLEYECLRSMQTKEVILSEAMRLVSIIREAIDQGFNEPINLIGGFCNGLEGKDLQQYAVSGQTLMGERFNMAMARSVVLAEMNGAAARVVAAPTGGAAGTLPGVLITVAEKVGCNEEKLAEAFLIAAAVGVVIGNRASFSGAVGGCQSEIGIGAAMAAAGAAWLANGSAQVVIHAAALALKNVLGLTCDPPASPVEVPCIKRNAMGTAVALMGAEMALAGLRSNITPDDVVVALADTQHRMPSELKGSCGGLSSTISGKCMRNAWAEKLRDMD